MSSPVALKIPTEAQHAAYVSAAELADVSLSEWFAAGWDAAAGLSALPERIANAERPVVRAEGGSTVRSSVRLTGPQKLAHGVAAQAACMTLHGWRICIADVLAGVSRIYPQIRSVLPWGPTADRGMWRAADMLNSAQIPGWHVLPGQPKWLVPVGWDEASDVAAVCVLRDSSGDAPTWGYAASYTRDGQPVHDGAYRVHAHIADAVADALDSVAK